MLILNEIPTWYIVIAIIFSSYYAYRGFMGNWIAMVQRNEDIKNDKRKFKNWEIISVFCIHDMFFHFICSLAGFFTLLVAKDLYQSLPSSESIDAGNSVLLAISFLFGVVGVTGQLPPLIQLGKFPGVK
jgi:hypothetical protein